MPENVLRHDIQGIIASGYDHLDHARFVFLQIIDSEKARSWLGKTVNLITNAEHPGSNKAQTCVNLALSWRGLDKLGVAELIEDFPHEFVGGMTRQGGHLILGDSGDSSEAKWEYGGSQGGKLHVLALLYGKTSDALDALHRQICSSRALNGGLETVVAQDSFREHGDFREPFGFRDGISQPPVRGLIGRGTPTEDPISTGEFVLGYQNELGQLTRIPSIDNWADPWGFLADHAKYPGRRRAFGLNGTYLVFRKLLQDVHGFWDFVDKRSMDCSRPVDPKKRELLAARMVGRWLSGAPLVLAPDAPGSEPENDFLFMPTDPDGLACPIGSHIRRANPRDSLDMPPMKSIQVSRRHRIIRRGRKFCELAMNSPADNPEYHQGIYFIALNADLRRQFEFIQQLWINNPTVNGLDNDKDPIVGDNSNDGVFTIQAKPVNCRIKGIPRFVTVKGGGYFFLPGIRALRFLSSYGPGAGTAQKVPPSSTPGGHS